MPKATRASGTTAAASSTIWQRTSPVTGSKKLFGAEHANVQPHSGTQANMAVYFAFMNLGDTLMSMKLTQGGHLSHGSPVSFTGKFYKVVQYSLDPETEMLDYGAVEEMARREKPKMLVCGASAYPRTIDFRAFQEIADGVGAYCMADIAHIAGLCATGVHPTSVGIANFTTTTTHKTLRGPRGGAIMCNSEYAQAIDKAVFPGMQGGPLMHTITAKAVCFEESEAFVHGIQQADREECKGPRRDPDGKRPPPRLRRH